MDIRPDRTFQHSVTINNTTPLTAMRAGPDLIIRQYGLDALCQQCVLLLVSYHYRTYSTAMPFVLFMTRAPHNKYKMIRIIKKMTVEVEE